MGATILESLSSRKLVGIILGLLLVQIIAFYIGAFFTPSPSGIQQFISTHCYRKDRTQLSIPRYYEDESIDQTNQLHYKYIKKNCDIISASTHNKHEKFRPTTFAVQLPLPRNGEELPYTRWMQTLLIILNFEFEFDSIIGNSKPQSSYQFPILLDVELGVRDVNWTKYIHRTGLKRTIHCHYNNKINLDCEHIQLFEIQLLHHYYLINFEIRDDPSSSTVQYPVKLKEISGVAIHHNGGFTLIWLSLKTLCFLATFSTLVWYTKRLNMMERKTILIERILLGLGISLTILDVPVEYLSLFYSTPFMSFLNDLRQGIFYCVLFSFWIIFFGEHLEDGTRKGRKLANYAKELLAIFVASFSLLIFDLSERGIQTLDPFLTIWESRPSLANLSIHIAICASLAYISYLLYYIYLAYQTISGRQVFLPKMQITKRLKYQGIIYRFKFLLWVTIVCAMSTFVFYAFSQRDDDSNEEESAIEWTSAMLITVCSMWNIYVVLLLILYAPSHKGMTNGNATIEEVEFDCLTDGQEEENIEGDMKLLTELTNKASID